jgi:UDPglucose--hexose-1-phosphate uridylyltransferase
MTEPRVEQRTNPITGRSTLVHARDLSESTNYLSPEWYIRQPRLRLPEGPCSFQPGARRLHNEVLLRYFRDGARWEEIPAGGSSDELWDPPRFGLPDWDLCVIRNITPFFLPLTAEATLEGGSLYHEALARGTSEVILETPRHWDELGVGPPVVCRATLEACQRRMRVAQAQGLGFVAMFRNHGPSASVQTHPVSQVVGLETEPTTQREDRARQLAYHGTHGTCLTCAMLALEVAREESLSGIVARNHRFVAFVPYAPEVPFETWILPRAHQPSFLQAGPEDLEALAELLTFVMGRFHLALTDPSYVLGIQTHPETVPEGADAAVHWRLVIKPKGLRHTGGLEDLHEVRICRTPPQEAAAWLRRRGNALAAGAGNILQAESDVDLVKALRILWRELGLTGETAERVWRETGRPLEAAPGAAELSAHEVRVLELAHERYEEIRFRVPEVCE